MRTEVADHEGGRRGEGRVKLDYRIALRVGPSMKSRRLSHSGYGFGDGSGGAGDWGLLSIRTPWRPGCGQTRDLAGAGPATPAFAAWVALLELIYGAQGPARVQMTRVPQLGLPSSPPVRLNCAGRPAGPEYHSTASMLGREISWSMLTPLT